MMTEKIKSFFIGDKLNKYFEYLQYLSIGILVINAIYAVYGSWNWHYLTILKSKTIKKKQELN